MLIQKLYSSTGPKKRHSADDDVYVLPPLYSSRRYSATITTSVTPDERSLGSIEKRQVPSVPSEPTRTQSGDRLQRIAATGDNGGLNNHQADSIEMVNISGSQPEVEPVQGGEMTASGRRVGWTGNIWKRFGKQAHYNKNDTKHIYYVPLCIMGQLFNAEIVRIDDKKEDDEAVFKSISEAYKGKPWSAFAWRDKVIWCMLTLIKIEAVQVSSF